MEPKIVEFSENVNIRDIKLSDCLSVFLSDKDEIWVMGDNN